jgi:hypothetical protein
MARHLLPAPYGGARPGHGLFTVARGSGGPPVGIEDRAERRWSSRTTNCIMVFLERQGGSLGHKFRVSLDTNRSFRTMEPRKPD